MRQRIASFTWREAFLVMYEETPPVSYTTTVPREFPKLKSGEGWMVISGRRLWWIMHVRRTYFDMAKYLQGVSGKALITKWRRRPDGMWVAEFVTTGKVTVRHNKRPISKRLRKTLMMEVME